MPSSLKVRASKVSPSRIDGILSGLNKEHSEQVIDEASNDEGFSAPRDQSALFLAKIEAFNTRVKEANVSEKFDESEEYEEYLEASDFQIIEAELLRFEKDDRDSKTKEEYLIFKTSNYESSNQLYQFRNQTLEPAGTNAFSRLFAYNSSKQPENNIGKEYFVYKSTEELMDGNVDRFIFKKNGKYYKADIKDGKYKLEQIKANQSLEDIQNNKNKTEENQH